MKKNLLLVIFLLPGSINAMDKIKKKEKKSAEVQDVRPAIGKTICAGMVYAICITTFFYCLGLGSTNKQSIVY